MKKLLKKVVIIPVWVILLGVAGVVLLKFSDRIYFADHIPHLKKKGVITPDFLNEQDI